DTAPRPSNRRDRAVSEKAAEFLADIDVEGDGLLRGAGERSLDHRYRGRAAYRRCDHFALLAQRFIDEGDDLADLGFHLKPSFPTISLASSPPARACTRGPVVITSTSTISLARGPSATPASMASK